MTQLLSSTTTPSFQHIRLVDLNDDSYYDLLAASQSDSQVVVMMNNRTGGFGAATILNVAAAYDVYAADMNGDGYVDIAASGGNCTTSVTFGAYWFQNNGNLTAPSWSTANVIVESKPSSYAAQRIALGDLNHDGNTDAVVLWEQVRSV